MEGIQISKDTEENSHMEWNSRIEVPVHKEYYDLQFQFAKKVAHYAGIPLLTAIKRFAPAIRNGVFTKDKDTGEFILRDEVAEENIVTCAYDEMLRKINTEPIPYHRGARFGCVSYDYDELSHVVTLHFENVEHGTTGPLSREKLPLRRREVADMVKDIKEKHPEAESILGHSWLYNLETYRSIFPKSFTDNFTSDESLDNWANGPTIWGQFLTKSGTINQARADALIARMEELPKTKNVTDMGSLMREFMSPPLMLPLATEAPITDFYKEYGVL